MEAMPANSAPTLDSSALPVPRDGIAGAAPYGAPQLEVAHALNVNENPYGPSPQLAEAVGRAAAEAAAGANAIMHQLLLAYGGPGRTALGFTPHYSMYPEYARDTYTEWVTAERGPAPDFALTAEAVTAAIAEHSPSIVVLTSPNNPT